MSDLFQLVLEFFLWCVGALAIYVATLGKVTALPVKARADESLPGRGNLFFQRDGKRYMSTSGAQALGAIILVFLTLLLWGFW